MTMTASAVRKPARVVARSTVHVTVEGTASWNEIIDFGLDALGTSRDSVYNYGVEGHRSPFVEVTDDTVIVYADRD